MVGRDLMWVPGIQLRLSGVVVSTSTGSETLYFLLSIFRGES